jgi:uncharacterized protein YdcH (DUF465 family)
MGENALGGGGMSPADMAAVMRGNYGGYNDGWGGNCWWIVILFLALMWGGNGMWGNNGFQNAIGYENLATSNEVQRGFDNQNSMSNQREILASVKDASYQGMQNANQNTQYITGQLMDKYNELDRDIQGISMAQQAAIANQNQCCCETKMLISETAANQRYESAMQNNAAIQVAREEGAATRAMIQQYRYDDLMRDYNKLDQRLNTQELRSDIAAATANVVRYPNGFVYNAGPSPFCTCGNNWGGCCAA